MLLSDSVAASLRAARWLGVVAVLAAPVPSLASSNASGIENVAWAYADRPGATKEYRPAPSHRYNSAGGAITIVPLAKGSYRVDFARLYNDGPSDMQVNGDLQVSAVQTTGYCTGDGLRAHKRTLQAYVSCFTARGKPANGRFTLLFQLRNTAFGDANTGMAYLWANAAGGGYNPFYQYNSTGGINAITTYDGAGTFTAFIPGLTGYGGDVQAVAFNYAGPARCTSGAWGGSGSGTSIDVRCFDVHGKPAYAIFYLTYGLNVPFGRITGAASNGAYAWADQPSNVNLYTPDTSYQYNGFGTGTSSVQRTGTGRYTVSIPGTLTYQASIAFVTAYAFDGDPYPASNYCNIAGWGVQTIDVACYQQGGAPGDAYFNVAFQSAG